MESAALRVDERTGAPQDYEALFTAYHGMVLGMAARMGIPLESQEDAAQEVELRFWKQDALAWYDPQMLHAAPAQGWRDGSQAKARTAKFGTFYRKFVWSHMRQEVDRTGNYLRRVVATDADSMPDGPIGLDHSEQVCEVESARDWLSRTSEALQAAGAGHLVPLLAVQARSGMEGRSLTRAEMAAELGISAGTASKQCTQLRALLSQLGYGPESLGRTA
jgi:hypothetical protein